MQLRKVLSVTHEVEIAILRCDVIAAEERAAIWEELCIAADRRIKELEDELYELQARPSFLLRAELA